jgi:hypothetical protein
LIYFGVLLLSGYGIAFLANKLNARLRGVAAAAFVLLFLFEVYPTNLPYGQPVVYQPSILDTEIAKLSKNKSEPLVVLHYPITELAETDLELIEAPRADTARYDELRDISTQEPETHHAP